MESPKTVLHALHDRASHLADRPALWTKQHGYYLPLSWRAYEDQVKALALGLRQLGIADGDVVAIQAGNREEWLLTHLATMAVGAVPVGVTTRAPADEVEGFLKHVEARAWLVESPAQLARARASAPRLPALRHLLVLEPPSTLPAGVRTFEEVLAGGRGRTEAPYWDRVNDLEPGALAALVYRPVEDGAPRAVMLSHRNLVWAAVKLTQMTGLGTGEVLVSYLPLVGITEQLVSLHVALVGGAQVYFAEGEERLGQTLKEVRPTVLHGPPRVWEALEGWIEAEREGESPRRRQLLQWARESAAQYHQRVLAHERIPGPLEVRHQAGRRLALAGIKERLGVDRTRLFIGGGAVRRETSDTLASYDVVLREGYGMPETTGPIALNAPDETRLGTVGRPLIGVEVRIADDGELRVRGENVCLGYYRDEEATRARLVDGWLRTGVHAELDADGYLRRIGGVG